MTQYNHDFKELSKNTDTLRYSTSEKLLVPLIACFCLAMLIASFVAVIGFISACKKPPWRRGAAMAHFVETAGFYVGSLVWLCFAVCLVNTVMISDTCPDILRLMRGYLGSNRFTVDVQFLETCLAKESAYIIQSRAIVDQLAVDYTKVRAQQERVAVAMARRPHRRSA